MAYKGKVISNRITEQSIRFITTSKDSKGRLLEMLTTYEPYSTEPTPHYHPTQEEQFIVLEGALTVKLGEETIVLQKGQSINIPKNTIHSMWNNSAMKTVVTWNVSPALNTEYFLETAMGLANNGKTNKKGMPNILQVALLALKHSNEFRLSAPPFFVQKLIFYTLTPIALLTGKRANYEEYID